jgi:hypothetical protein
LANCAASTSPWRQHSHIAGLGENLAEASYSSFTCTDAVNLFVAERKYCPCPTFSEQTGHFTQVVWKGTTAVGCGWAQCNGFVLITCRYSPPGNVIGQFAQNV